MPTNERANKLREKKRQKDKKTKIIIWSVLGVIVLTIAIMKICEIDFADVKNKISANTAVSSVSEDVYPYSLNISGNTDVAVVNDKLAVLSDSSLTVFNPTNAKKTYSFEHGYTNPVMLSSGNYICIYDRGSTRLRLDTTSKQLYEKTVDRNIICASLAPNGTVAYASFSDDADCELTVITKTERKKMTLPIKGGYITRIAVNSSGTKCTYVTVSSTDAVITSTVHTINVGDSEDTATAEFQSSNILDVTYSDSNDAYIIGDDFLSIVSSQKKFVNVFEKGTVSTVNYCYTAKNELIVNYRDYSNSSESNLAYIKSNGSVKCKTTLGNTVKYLSSSGNNVTVLFPDGVSTYSLSKFESKKTYKCDSSINSVHSLGSKIYIQYGQYIDVM
ncbi:DUF5711 family protein [uncultured Eubacterium sp.]|uniref:DUF5711 family protein n=1 Tax=uncultured Eubacterium sp. TaxID=165185 RepID=UPI0015B34C34|nr:DUF5711 family protein [uncultured Eubacterium sp.]